MPLTVMLCCNDPRNGNPLGYIEALEIDGIALEGGRTRVFYKTTALVSAKKHEGEHTLRIGRLQVPALGYSTWTGNWCWDSATVRGVHALRILNFLAKKTDWQCTEAPREIYEAFNDRRVITAEEWKRRQWNLKEADLRGLI